MKCLRSAALATAELLAPSSPLRGALNFPRYESVPEATDPTLATTRQLKHEEETRRRAEAALKAARQDKVKQAEEVSRRKMYTRRTGGGFVISFAKEEPATPLNGPSET